MFEKILSPDESFKLGDQKLDRNLEDDLSHESVVSNATKV